MLLDIKNKGSLLSSDVTIHNIEKHAEVSKPEHINLEFESVTQRNNSIEVEYRIINKDKSKSLPNKVVITGFKDSLTNENIIIKPEVIPPINHEKPIMKDVETNTNDESSSSVFKHISSLLAQLWNSKRFACSIRTSKKQIVSLIMNVKLKKQDISLNELTAYPYDLIDVDDNANKLS